MEYNKKDFTKANDKKVLHKIRKHWVVVSTALLMTLGGGAAATHVSAHADTADGNNGTATKADAVKEQLNSQLQQPKQQPQQSQQSATNGQSQQKPSAQPAQPSTKVITKQAAALHNSILGNAAQQKPKRMLGSGPSQEAGGSSSQQTNPDGWYDNDQLFTKAPVSSGSANHYYYPSDGFVKGSTTKTPGSIIYKPYTSNNGSDYGQISVEYFDNSNKQVVSTVPTQEGTSSSSFKMSDYLNTMPQNGAYQLADPGNNGYNSIDAGAGTTTFVPGETQYVVINVLPTPKKGDGQILVQYEDPYVKINGHNKVLATHLQSDQAGQAFNLNGFTSNPPEGYQADGYSFTDSSDPTVVVQNTMSDSFNAVKSDNSKFKALLTPSDKFQFAAPNVSAKNNPGAGVYTLHIFVEPQGQTTQATINYVDKNTGAVVGSRTVSGSYNKTNKQNGKNVNIIPISDFNQTVPSGYVYDGSNLTGDHSSASDVSDGNFIFTPNNATVVTIDVKKGTPVPAPQPLSSYANIIVKYFAKGKDSSTYNQLVGTLTLSKPSGDTTNSSDSTKINSVPAGYQLTQAAKNYTGPSGLTYGYQRDSEIDLDVNAIPNYVAGSVTNDKISYAFVTQKSDGTFSEPTQLTSPVFYLHGNAGTVINYSPYIQNVPSGYVYAGQMESANSTMGNNQDNVILVESTESLTKPITVKYINEAGSDVTPTITGTYTGAVNGYYGQKYSVNDLITNTSTKMPSDYSLDNPDVQGKNQYSIGSSAQIVPIMVHGQSITADPSKASDVLNIYQNVSDGSGHDTSYPITTVPMGGSDGNVTKFYASNYMPTPSSNYQAITGNYEKAFGANNFVQSVKLVKKTPTTVELQVFDPTTNKWQATNSITFNYKQLAAIATVRYKDMDTGNFLNDNNDETITGSPNEVMTSLYSNLKDTPPAGYTVVGPDPTNAANLVDGGTYVMDVTSAHVGGPTTGTNQNRPGYVNVTINYGKNLGKAGAQVYSTVTVNHKSGSDFNAANYLKPIINGGLLPNTYANATKASDNQNSDLGSITSDKTFNIDVTQIPSAYNLPVTDMIDYVPVTPQSDGHGHITAWNRLEAAPVMTVEIHGATGNKINYAQYQNHIPQETEGSSTGYAYSGMGTTNPDYEDGFDTQSNPIATIYVSPAKESNSNGGGTPNPAFHPSDADTYQTSDTHHKKGDPIPYDPFNPNGDAPLNGKSYHHQLGGLSTSGSINDGSYAGGKNGSGQPTGKIPTGYSPAYVPDVVPETHTNGAGQTSDVMESDGHGGKKPTMVPGTITKTEPNGQGGTKTVTVPDTKDGTAYGTPNYKPGFVPSSDVPSGYVPGYVPTGKKDGNGNPTYIPGYVPGNPNDIPGNPKYVPGEVIADSKGDKVPGLVPDVPPYAPKGQSASLAIQYVNNMNHSDVIQTVYANGQVGQTLVLKGNVTGSDIDGRDYLNDVPVGYTNAQVLTDAKGTSTPLSSFYYSDGSVTPVVQIGVSQQATGNIVYEDSSDGNAQVGMTPITGYNDQTEDITESSYLQLLPYGYKLGNNSNSNLKFTLQNGNNYPVYVTKGDYKPQMPPTPLKSNYGTITVNYVTTNGTTVGTQQFVDKTGMSLHSDDSNATNDVKDDVPYGYKLDSSNNIPSDIYSTKFANPASVMSVKVDPTPTNGKTEVATDKIAYYNVTRSPNSKSDVVSNNPVATIPVTGNIGTAINYTPYQNNVPTGYSYKAMGTHSNTIDAVHTGPVAKAGITTNHPYDVIYVQKAPELPKQSKITIKYKYMQGGVSKSDLVTISGLVGQSTHLGYYQKALPHDLNDSYQFDHMNSDGNVTDPLHFTDKSQIFTVWLKPQDQYNYGHIDIHFVDLGQADLPTKSGSSDAYDNALNGVDMGSNTESTSQMKGHAFNLESYEYNVPEGYRFDHILDGGQINSYQANNQDLYIGVRKVDTNNGSVD